MPQGRRRANVIDRTYRVRGKEVHLRELADLIAIRGDESGERPFRRPAGVDPQAALSNVRAFEQAGWRFVPRQDATGGAKVYLKPNGRVALGTNRLTVRVANDVPEIEARRLIEARGFTVIERLRFAPNLFLVAAAEGRDSVEALGQLMVPGKVEFAEPELIEMMSGR